MRTQLYHALTLFLTTITLLLSCVYAQALSPAEAAEQARSTGGKVLQVRSRKDGGYRVKILMPNGQVQSISVGNSPEAKSERSDKKSRSKKQ
ncbi:MAG: hypothetical protein ACJAUP_001059 [Cellvibrionaceae bacterium]|jgi:hypothetical protein